MQTQQHIVTYRRLDQDELIQPSCMCSYNDGKTLVKITHRATIGKTQSNFNSDTLSFWIPVNTILFPGDFDVNK